MAAKASEVLSQALEKFQGMDTKIRIWILVFALFAFFLLDYLLLMGPYQLAPLQKIIPENHILRQDIRSTREDFSSLDTFKDRVEDLKRTYTAENFKLRSKAEVPIIMEKISSIASDNSMRIDQIIPDTIDQETILETEDRRFSSLSIRVEAMGGYHDLGRFLNQLENDSLLIGLSDFTLSKGKARELKINLTLKAIVYEAL